MYKRKRSSIFIFERFRFGISPFAEHKRRLIDGCTSNEVRKRSSKVVERGSPDGFALNIDEAEEEGSDRGLVGSSH